MNSTTANFPISSEVPRRRNGRPQSCENCRRRKVACDHRLPICSRCIRKGVPQSCRYLIQGQLVTLGSPSVTTRSQSAGVFGSRQQGEPATPKVPTLSPATLEDLASPCDENVGYLGATSFPEFYRETWKHLDHAACREPTVDGLAGNNESGMSATKMAPDAAAFEAAVSVLRTIPTKDAADYMHRRNINPNYAWCRLALDRLHSSLWAELGNFLEGDRNNEAMSQLALLLFHNSSKPLREDFADPEQWFGAFTGVNFRWEGLGLLFTFWTFGTLSLSENSTAEQRKWLGNHNRRNLMQMYKTSATKCVDLCRRGSCNNTMMVYLLHTHSLTESLITGDTGAEFWRQHADAVAMVTFLGLHTSQPSNPLPEDSLSVQIKRRVFCAVFNIDMVVSTLTGRPPLLSSRFCSTPLPLDVDDASLMDDKIKSHRVDEDGWSTEGSNLPIALLRACELRKRELDAMSHFPPALQFKKEDFYDHMVNPSALYMRLLVRLEHLGNLFFIERLSYKGNGLYSSQMLEISLEMISLTLAFWTQQNRLEGLQGDYEWLVMLHAAPAGGILCMELLKTSCGAQAATTAKITKSMIIKQLSLLISFLEWIGPTTPSAHLCNSIKSVVERVIEQALNPAPRPSTQQEFDMTWDTSLPEDMSDFNFELLDTFDWLRLPPNTI
ncbi:hypothetical protein Trco_001695 [Trichoderma cornu-damae]|uniref:Zn(2)-C6 fungal-type domain-containing protein n=1 Tax=Trichoderma cornu-damae TaxID=654480 RepID=A0A9P8TYG1_9HYPO|nr:hypothetical protein Trco_001695 [Trichoderma cornu-damae]